MLVRGIWNWLFNQIWSDLPNVARWRLVVPEASLTRPGEWEEALLLPRRSSWHRENWRRSGAD
jgi:hypothetical protein